MIEDTAPRRRKRWREPAGLMLAGGLALVLAGCASYRPVPLPAGPDLAESIPMVSAGQLAGVLPGIARGAFEPGTKLDMVQVATLAVLGNPDLKAERAKVRVAGAEAFAAGLLPDPQLSLSLDRPTGSGPGLVNAYGIGLNYDISSLITLGAKSAAFKSAFDMARLDLLWREWQVIEKARTLHVRLAAVEKTSMLLRQVQELFARRYRSSSVALRRGDVTLDSAGTDLTALMDVNSRLAQTEQLASQVRHDLKALLGLGPDVRLEIAPLGPPSQLSESRFVPALKAVASRRPDLLALQAGYRSQEAKVRQAILAQFPAINVGFNRARDTGNVRTVGLAVTLSLPLLNRSRGEIRVQRATRAQLREEYQARLDRTEGQAHQLRDHQRLVLRQLQVVTAYLPALQAMVEEARRAYASNDIGALTYLNMENTLVQKRQEEIDLAKEMWMSRIALDTLLAWPERREGVRDPSGSGGR